MKLLCIRSIRNIKLEEIIIVNVEKELKLLGILPNQNLGEELDVNQAAMPIKQVSCINEETAYSTNSPASLDTGQIPPSFLAIDSAFNLKRSNQKVQQDENSENNLEEPEAYSLF